MVYEATLSIKYCTRHEGRNLQAAGRYCSSRAR
jgi:hypothetical protein